MPSHGGVHWHCPNRECDWSFVAAIPAQADFVQLCVCGSEMRMGEVVPPLHYLDFLHDDVEAQEEVETGKG